MSSLFYILKRSFINTVKGLIKKPAALIAYIVIAGFFISMFILSGMGGQSEKNSMDLDIVKSIFVAYTVFLFVITLVASLSSGSSFFRLADVNFLFTAPVKAGNILIYGFVKQFAINLMVLVFVSFQYPNWKRTFGLIDGAGFILIIAYVLMVILTSVLGMVIYSVTSKKPGRRDMVKGLLYAGVILFVSPIALGTVKTGDLLKSAVSYLSHDSIKYIPFIGWFREVLLGSFTGITSIFLMNSFFILAASALIFIYLYKMDTDFFEDVLSNTETKETLLKAVREGKTGAAYGNNRKYRKVKFNFTMEGSKAIYQRQLLEQQKTGIGFISFRTLLLLTCAIVAALTVKVEGSILLSVFLAIAVYIMMLFTMIGSWAGELSKHYIYLLPVSSFSKMIYTTIPEVIKILLEGIIVLGISGIIVKAPILTVIAAVIVYTTMGAVFTYSDLFIRKMFGKIHGNVIRGFFRFFVLIFILLPAIISAAVIIGITHNFALAFIVAALLNLIFIFLFMLAGVSLFNNPEFE